MVDLSALKAALSASGRLLLTLKVTPKSSRNEIVTIMDDGTLRIKIAAVPEKGKANAEICAFLADQFGVPKSAVRVIRGETSSNKLVEITR